MSRGLVARGLRVSYGHVRAVHGFDLDVQPGEIVALLGPNGAGKSSIVRGISGVAPSSADELSVGGVDLREMRPDSRARFVAHVAEGRHLFGDHTVRENLMLGAFHAKPAERRRRLDGVLALLPELTRHLDRPASALSGGQQQMVAIARGLMASAPVLIVDELSLGLAPIVARTLGEAISRLRGADVAVVCVEQYVPLALSIADRVVVVDHGVAVLSGSTAQVADRVRELQAAYLGTSETLEPYVTATARTNKSGAGPRL
jgi:branched-chain amino acid transport system ATP-binding protein